jgi:SAM-dependent methyltransferase
MGTFARFGAAEIAASLYPDDAFTTSNGTGGHVKLDTRAADTLERLIGRLVVEQKPKILDLMAGPESHLPDGLVAVGLGPDAEAMARNPQLTERVVHDLNLDPRLPFGDGTFDAVLCTLSIEYLTRPFHVVADAARVLKPGGLLLVVSTHRTFKGRAVRIWLDSSDRERLRLVEDMFTASLGFDPAVTYISKGQPRPKDDKFAGTGVPSDPIFAVYADKIDRPEGRALRPFIEHEPDAYPPKDVVEERMKHVGETLRCPYCEDRLGRWDLPESPFLEWPNEYMYICLNNDCPYLLSGWEVMSEQGAPGLSYRLMYNPIQKRCMPTPMPNRKALLNGRIAPHG